MSERTIQQKLGFATVTWRYLRIAIVLLVVGLAVAVGYEVIDGGGNRFLTSISAYYYTPVHAYFVGALVSIGVCLFCIKGNTELEDLVLNLAGIFAPVVALVPTPDADGAQKVLFTKPQIDANVANNMTALFVVGAIGLLAGTYLSLRNGSPRATKIGLGAVSAPFVVYVVWFLAAPDSFMHNAHFWSAGLMFFFIIVVVWINAIGYRHKKGTPRLGNRYYAIAITMVISVAGALIAKCAGADHWLLVLEIALITLFAAFWGTQTAELWNEGLRSPAPTSSAA